MELYHTTDTEGVSELNPETGRMREILARLDEPGAEDPEHPDVTLVHDPSGWAASVYPSGIITLENFEDEDEPPRHLPGMSRHEALTLWTKLARGEIEAVKAYPWRSPE
ncbi:MAG: hypothetical protein ACLFUF_04870 [Opitutales bacterium]